MKNNTCLYGRSMFTPFCLLVLVFPLAGLARPIPSKFPGTWSTKAPLPTTRFEVGVVAVDGKVYVIGGESNGEQATRLNTVYDPATDRWSELAPIPHETSHPGVAASKNKIYVFGGFTGVPHVGAMDIAFEYDIATNKWRALRSALS